MISMTLEDAEKYVSKASKTAPGSVRWDGWKMVFHTPDQTAMRNPNGRYHNGRWGLEKVVEPNSEGIYLISHGMLVVNKMLNRGKNARR